MARRPAGARGRLQDPSRRALIARSAAMAVAAAAGAPRAARGADAAKTPHAHAAPQGYVPRPGPTQYDFAVTGQLLAPDGAQPVPAVTVNGTIPGPEIRVREGDTLRVLVRNGLADSPTSVHWHGVLVPAGMDGVPDISNAPIPPRQTYVYEYPIRQTGTYWYHSHFGFQEQQGMYGAFVVEEANDPVHANRDAVVLLGDWLHESPAAVFAALQKGKEPPAGGDGTKPMAGMAAVKGGADLSDVEYPSFLLNGRAPAAPWTLEVRPGERVRLRIVNGGTSTYFRVQLDGHALEVTHADGLAVQPVVVDEILMGMGETYDVLVKIATAGRFTLHAVAQDGSGQAVGVLHTPGVDASPAPGMPPPGKRVLAYAQLRAPQPTTLPAGPVRSFRLPLQGDMKSYVWMIDGQAWPKADPLAIAPGDRVQVELVNQTMMWHPMHLHGHFFRVLNGAGDFCPLKHTVNVAPGETLRFEFTADNPGRWFFHCHNLYHLEGGMAREFVYVI